MRFTTRCLMLLALLALLFLWGPLSRGDTLGTVAWTSQSCPSGGVANGVCYKAVISSCAGTDATFQALVKVNYPTGTPKGLVTFTNGSGGNGAFWDTYYTSTGMSVITGVLADGYITVQFNYNGTPFGWLGGGTSLPGVRALACRNATANNAVFNNLGTGLSGPINTTPNLRPFCAVGVSAGSSSLAYAVGIYGVPFDYLQLDSGPPHTNLGQACGTSTPTTLSDVCAAPAVSTELLAQQSVSFVDPAYTTDPTMTNPGPCTNHDPTYATRFTNDSVLAPGAPTSFPNTVIHQLMGSLDDSQAIAQATLYDQTVGQVVSSCVTGAQHQMPNTTVGANAILADIAANCQTQAPPPPPVLTFTPSSFNFGTVTQGTSSTPEPIVMSVTVSNESITSITVTPGANTPANDFTQTNNCGTQVNSGSQCTITATYSPTAAAGTAESATITVNGTATSGNTVALSGTSGSSGGGGGAASCANSNEGFFCMLSIPDLATDNLQYCPGGGTTCYPGGLYPNNSNTEPAALQAQLNAVAAQVQPVNGKFGFLSVGYSIPNEDSAAFFGYAKIQTSPKINTTTQVLVDGAIGSTSACDWETYSGNSNCGDGTTTSNLYDFLIASTGAITKSGLVENQIVVMWTDQVDPHPEPGPTLPASNADAFTLEARWAGSLRAAEQRYSNLILAIATSRVYGGYMDPVNGHDPEPYSYEAGFALKWMIQAQRTQCPNSTAPYCTGPIDPVAGDMNFDGNNTTCTSFRTSLPIRCMPLLWSPVYLWAPGPTPTLDGTVWCDGSDTPAGTGFGCDGTLDDMQPDDTHLVQAQSNQTFGTQRVALKMWNYFKNTSNTFTAPWFLAH